MLNNAISLRIEARNEVFILYLVQQLNRIRFEAVKHYRTCYFPFCLHIGPPVDEQSVGGQQRFFYDKALGLCPSKC